MFGSIKIQIVSKPDKALKSYQSYNEMPAIVVDLFYGRRISIKRTRPYACNVTYHLKPVFRKIRSSFDEEKIAHLLDTCPMLQSLSPLASMLIHIQTPSIRV